MDSIKEKITSIKGRKEFTELKMAFFDGIHLVPDVWDKLAESSLYLSRSYLKAIEDAMHPKMEFRYILFSKNNIPVAIAAFQIIGINSEGLDIETPERKREKVLGKVLDTVNLQCLINGTLFGSGEHGFYYSEELNDDEAFAALADGIKRLCALEEAKDKIHIIMVKEYFPERSASSDHLITRKYRSFKMEPNMVLEIKESWTTMDDYLASMTSKYRSRTKSNLKKSVSIIEKELTPREIEFHLPRLKELFTAVHSKAKHSLGTLDISSFIDLKKELADRFICKAYFLDDIIVGFISIFINGNSLDANYVGIDYEHNKSLGIYQRMLADLVKLGIEEKIEKIHFGRTASEIKSNFGAKAVDMICYVRTKNSVSNKIIKPLVKRISTPDFVERNPFKS